MDARSLARDTASSLLGRVPGVEEQPPNADAAITIIVGRTLGPSPAPGPTEHGQESQSDANYTDRGPAPFVCANCSYYQAGLCDIVEGEVSETATCRHFSPIPVGGRASTDEDSGIEEPEPEETEEVTDSEPEPGQSTTSDTEPTPSPAL